MYIISIVDPLRSFAGHGGPLLAPARRLTDDSDMMMSFGTLAIVFLLCETAILLYAQNSNSTTTSIEPR